MQKIERISLLVVILLTVLSLINFSLNLNGKYYFHR